MLNIKYVGRKRYKPQKKAFKKLYTYVISIWYIGFGFKGHHMADSIQKLHTPHYWGHLVLVWSLPKIHSSHLSLEEMPIFEAIFKMSGT